MQEPLGRQGPIIRYRGPDFNPGIPDRPAQVSYIQGMVEPYVEAITTNTSCHCVITPLNIGFICKRFEDGIDPSVANIYQKIFNMTIQEEFTYDASNCCHPDQVAGSCGHFRGHLGECRCGPLDRSQYPKRRGEYEDKVVKTVLEIFKNSPFKSFNIASFASGHLHGELVLMAKLISRLHNENFKGKIKLFLIDRIYQESIQKAFLFKDNTDASLSEYLGGREDLCQFLKEITYGLPPEITLKAALFGEAEDYIWSAQHKNKYRSDLVIGADTEDKENTLSRIERGSQKRDIPSILLAKSSDNIPLICDVKDVKNEVKFDCYRPND